MVLAVAVVSTVAEAHATWEGYFQKERAIAVATPAAMALLVASLAGGLVIVATAPDD